MGQDGQLDVCDSLVGRDERWLEVEVDHVGVFAGFWARQQQHFLLTHFIKKLKHEHGGTFGQRVLRSNLMFLAKHSCYAGDPPISNL